MPDTPEKLEQEFADELGKQQNNNELNIQSNSSVTEGGLIESDDPTINGDTSWRDAETGEDMNERNGDSNSTENSHDNADYAKTANK